MIRYILRRLVLMAPVAFLVTVGVFILVRLSPADPAKRKQLLLQAQQIYTVDDPSRVWYGFGVSPLVTVKNLVGMESYPDRIPRFQAASLQK